jgi:hypothetical protein
VKPAYDRPLAAPGLTSYRYRGRFGFIMIGAVDNSDALRQALRSTAGPLKLEKLEIWNGSNYEPA